MALPPGIEGLLLDIDGTLVADNRAVKGAADLVADLRRRSVPFRLFTNTTRMGREKIASWVRRAGIEIEPSEVLAPSLLASRRILDSGKVRAALLVAPATLPDFNGVESTDEKPDWVVIGDLGKAFTWEKLNQAFLQLRDGSRLLALQKNRYWRVEGKLRLDAGPFVAALEFAAGIQAEVVGKPSPSFFALALEELGVAPKHVLVVGDDVRTDVGGGRRAGCFTALVRTGKFSPEDLSHGEDLRPNLVLDSVADLASE